MSQSDAALSPFGVKTQGPTINDLPPVARAFLTQHGSVRLYRREEEVQRRRVAPTLASWLLEGRIRACVYLPDGLEQSHGWVMPGELFGVFNLLLPGYLLPGLAYAGLALYARRGPCRVRRLCGRRGAGHLLTPGAESSCGPIGGAWLAHVGGY